MLIYKDVLSIECPMQIADAREENKLFVAYIQSIVLLYSRLGSIKRMNRMLIVTRLLPVMILTNYSLPIL